MNVRDFFETVCVPKDGVIAAYRDSDVPIEEYLAIRTNECPFFTLDKNAPTEIYEFEIYLVHIHNDGSFRLLCSKPI